MDHALQAMEMVGVGNSCVCALPEGCSVAPLLVHWCPPAVTVLFRAFRAGQRAAPGELSCLWDRAWQSATGDCTSKSLLSSTLRASGT